MKPHNTHQRHDSGKTNHPCRKNGKGAAKVAIAIAALSLTFWLLWNWAAVPLFTFPSLTYLQALVAIMLMGVLIRTGRRMTGRNHSLAHIHRSACTHRRDRHHPNNSRYVTFGDMMW